MYNIGYAFKPVACVTPIAAECICVATECKMYTAHGARCYRSKGSRVVGHLNAGWQVLGAVAVWEQERLC